MHSSDDNPGLYGKIQKAFLDTYKALDAKGIKSSFLVESADQTLPQTRVIWGAPHLIHSGEPAGILGIYNLALATVQEATIREGTPDDTMDKLDLQTSTRKPLTLPNSSSNPRTPRKTSRIASLPTRAGSRSEEVLSPTRTTSPHPSQKTIPSRDRRSWVCFRAPQSPIPQ